MTIANVTVKRKAQPQRTGQFLIRYEEGEVFPQLLHQEARSRGITPEQYIRRLVAENLASVELPQDQLPKPGATWADYFYNNGVLTA